MASFSWRMPDDVRNELDKAARKSRRNLSDELVARLRWSFAREREQERDPALRALNFVIAELAEQISGANYMADRELRLEEQKDWRTDPFKFRAFKFAVGKLLDALDPPKRESPFSEAKLSAIKEEALQKSAKWAAEKFGYTPEMQKWFIETEKTPEAKGASALGFLWDRLTRTSPLTEKEKELALRYPRFGEVMEREFYGFDKARRDLGISPLEAARIESPLLGIDKYKSVKGD